MLPQTSLLARHRPIQTGFYGAGGPGWTPRSSKGIGCVPRGTRCELGALADRRDVELRSPLREPVLPRLTCFSDAAQKRVSFMPASRPGRGRGSDSPARYGTLSVWGPGMRCPLEASLEPWQAPRHHAAPDGPWEPSCTFRPARPRSGQGSLGNVPARRGTFGHGPRSGDHRQRSRASAPGPTLAGWRDAPDRSASWIAGAAWYLCSDRVPAALVRRQRTRCYLKCYQSR